MNKHLNITHEAPHRPVAAMPLAPRKYTAEDIFFLAQAGLLNHSTKFELFEGEIVPMSPKGANHEATRVIIARWLRGRWANKFDALQEHTLTVEGDTVIEPDFAVFTRGIDLRKRPLTGADIHLVIEVADTSLSYDLKKKSQKFAAFGVAEYWVVDVDTGQTHVHRNPGKKGWAETRIVPKGKPIAPLCAPKAALKF